MTSGTGEIRMRRARMRRDEHLDADQRGRADELLGIPCRVRESLVTARGEKRQEQHGI